MTVNPNQIAAVAVVVPGPAPANRTSMPLILTNPDGSTAGTVKKAAAQPDSTATDVAGLKTDFNALLAKLRTAGVISSS